MIKYDILLDDLKTYREQDLYHGVTQPISIRAGHHLYFVTIDEDGTLTIYTRYYYCLKALLNKQFKTMDEQMSISAYMCFIEPMSQAMFKGFNRAGLLPDSYAAKDTSVICLSEGAFPRFISDDEADALITVVRVLREALAAIKESNITIDNTSQYYRYADLTHQMFVDTLEYEKPHQHIQASVDNQSVQDLKDRPKSGTWYVALMYIPMREKGAEGFPALLLAYDREADHFVVNSLIAYEKKNLIYRTFIENLNRYDHLPSKIIAYDYKTLCYIKDFIDRTQINYDLKNDVFFKKCYQYAENLIETAEIIK